LALVQKDGSAPNLKQATLRYLAGFLLPLSLPILIHLFAERSRMSQHAAGEPKLQIPEKHLMVSPEALLVYREWEAAGRQMRARLNVLLWLLYGGELALMGLIMFFHPHKQGWHNLLAGTYVIPRRPSRKSPY
jgi:uncharacterized RDD family membrane protein YckC